MTSAPPSARRPVTKAVIPAAGMGTRFLPATKAIPKEMLPVVDRPAIQYVVEEAVAAGLEDVLMVTGRNKGALEDHFDRNWELEQVLEAKGDEHRLARVRRSTVLADVHYVRQGDPRGLGHAVLCAEKHVGDEPFAVLLGDDLIDARDPLLSTMLAAEIQLTDALQTLAASDQPGGGVRGVVFRGRRYDTGDRLDYLKAVVQLGAEHDELGADFSAWLERWTAQRR